VIGISDIVTSIGASHMIDDEAFELIRMGAGKEGISS